MVSGYDLNRVIIIIAVLEKRIGIPLDNPDVFINVVGGIKIKETASDLAIACAIASANNGVVCPDKTVIFGEVGLAGEVRAVSQIRERLTEAEKLGFKKAIIPKSNLKSLN
ncbi:MAG: DNA repair protein RadA, partial [Elusimicrobia bacterium]|nr:DNA repair protein RadA [Elusimicrobiota bacterium]